MSNVVLFISFNLVKGASVPDFLQVSEKLNDEYMSKQKGYISWKQLVGSEGWVDLITWETMADAEKVLQPGITSALLEEFYSFIDPESCDVHLYSVEKSY